MFAWHFPDSSCRQRTGFAPYILETDSQPRSPVAKNTCLCMTEASGEIPSRQPCEVPTAHNVLGTFRGHSPSHSVQVQLPRQPIAGLQCQR
jgi:hypothetical protein